MTSWADRPVIERWSSDASFIEQLAPATDPRWPKYFAFDLSKREFLGSTEFYEWHELSYELGLVVKFHYDEWLGEHPEFRGESRDLSQLSVADALRLFTFIARSDRFSEGALDHAIETGRIPALVEIVRRHIEPATQAE